MRHGKALRGIGACLLGTLAWTASTQAVPRLAFRTSATGTGNLGSWPQAQGQTGLAAGDAICRTLAQSAGLPEPNAFVAWLSDQNTDAYCRMFGLTGKKANKCGQAALPTGAGPWNRTDGVAFADTIEKALDQGRVFSPLTADENGVTDFGFDTLAFTGTGIDGTYEGAVGWTGDCGEWSDENEFAPVGEVHSATGDWTFLGQAATCGQPFRLMCLQAGSGTPLPAVGRGHREAFLSSVAVIGNLSASPLAGGATGIAAGDAICRNLAQSVGLYRPQSFKALLADSQHNALTRFANDGPWYRIDGRLFAHSIAELGATNVVLPLNITETGQFIGEGESHLQGTTVAWTGASQDGSVIDGSTCQDWKTTSGFGQTSIGVNSIGGGESNFGSWISGESGGSFCDSGKARLFCLSDADVIYHDEFQSVP